jgi:hypothetical protein
MKNLVFILILGAFILAGCKQEPFDPEQDFQDVVVFSSAQSLLKSAASQAEDAISEIILYGLEGSTVVHKLTITAAAEITSITGNNGLKLTIPRKIRQFYAIANPSSALKTSLTNSPPANSNAFTSLADNFAATAPASPFLMSGNATVDTNLKQVNIQLTRAVAKVQFYSESDFTISSVVVNRTPNGGYVFARETVAVPGSSSRISYSSVSGSLVYVAENTSTTSTNTQFVVSGIFDSKSVQYPIDLKTGGTLISIERNKHYQVIITPITEHECTFKITNIPPWEDVIPDPVVVDYP